jgi:hypothetical protein
MYTHAMPILIEHDDDDDDELALQDPDEFLDRYHPENDSYMQAVGHIQRQIMHQTTLLRTKQVNILKTVFTGANYTETAKKHGTTSATVSRLVKSPDGQRLLNLLQYHLHAIEGPNESQRRNILWRIAQDNELRNPATAIKAVSELNKMHFQQYTVKQNENALSKPQVVININQDLLPKGALD